MTLTAQLDRYRLLVVVGTGGVGKTTIAAAIALDAAMRGRRALVLTIDPARALARALGLPELGAEQRVPADVLAAAGVAPRGVFAAAMLDQKRAWDAFVARHAPTPAMAEALYTNPFYQRLSTSFAGSTEYMAIEETCRLAESGAYDLIVLDTPPAAHALDFVHAPDRIDSLLERDVSRWFARGAWKSAGLTARFVLRRLEHATGKGTLRDVAAFFVGIDALVDEARARIRRARALLSGGDAAFVLVTAPRQLVIDETHALAARLSAQPTPLAGVVVNRVHAPAPVTAEVAARALDALGESPPAHWLRAAWADAVAEAEDERLVVERFAAMMPGVPVARVAEAEHDLHSLRDLAYVAGELQSPRTATAQL